MKIVKKLVKFLEHNYRLLYAARNVDVRTTNTDERAALSNFGVVVLVSPSIGKKKKFN